MELYRADKSFHNHWKSTWNDSVSTRDAESGAATENERAKSWNEIVFILTRALTVRDSQVKTAFKWIAAKIERQM